MNNPYRESQKTEMTTTEVETNDVVINIHYLTPEGEPTVTPHTFVGTPFVQKHGNELKSYGSRGNHHYDDWVGRIGNTQLIRFGDKIIPTVRLLMIEKISTTTYMKVVDIKK